MAPYAHRKNNRLGLIFKDIKDGLSPAGPPLDSSPEVWELWLLLQSCWNPDPSTRVNAAMVSASLSTLNGAPLAKSSLTTSGQNTKHTSSSQATSVVIPNESPLNNVLSTHVTPREWPGRSRRFRNISRDELNPIFMYWPENEPLPSIDQIRPSPALVSVQTPASSDLRISQETTVYSQLCDWDCGKCRFVVSLTPLKRSLRLLMITFIYRIGAAGGYARVVIRMPRARPRYPIIPYLTFRSVAGKP